MNSLTRFCCIVITSSASILMPACAAKVMRGCEPDWGRSRLECVEWNSDLDLVDLEGLCSGDAGAIGPDGIASLLSLTRVYWDAVVRRELNVGSALWKGRSNEYRKETRKSIASAIDDQYVAASVCCVGPEPLVGTPESTPVYATYTRVVFVDAYGICHDGVGILAWTKDEIGWRLSWGSGAEDPIVQ